MKLKIVSAMFAFLVMCALYGCGGGGTSTPTTTTTAAPTTATITGQVLVPSDTPTQSAKASFIDYAKRLFFPSLQAASTTKALDAATIAVGKINTDGKLEQVSTVTAATDASGNYTLTGVPEGRNLVVYATKNVKDTSGNTKIVSLEDFITVSASDIGQQKKNEALGVDTTLGVKKIKDTVKKNNQGKNDTEKIDGSSFSDSKIEDIVKVFIDNFSEIAAKTNLVDLIARDQNTTEDAFQQQLSTTIDTLQDQIASLKADLENQINALTSNGTLSGFIKDQSGNAISSATVSISGGALTSAQSATLFSNGQYILSVPVSQTAYTLTATLSGYKTITETIYLTGFYTVPKDITLVKTSAPTIGSLSSSSTTLATGGKATITCYAVDADGDALIFTWSATGGTITGSGNIVSYTAPNTRGTQTVTVKVSDGTNETSSTLDINVSTSPAEATLSASATSGVAPMTVTFTLGYVDPEGSAGTYTLDFGDSTGTSSGSINSKSTTTVSHTYQCTSTSCAYQPLLTVTDVAGAKWQDSLNLSIGGSSVVQISSGSAYTCVLLSAGSVKCWGQNEVGSLGNGTLTNAPFPTFVTELQNATGIYARAYHVCAIVTGGNVKCWGQNGQGQLGIGTQVGPQNCSGMQCSTKPETAVGVSSVKAVTTGNQYTCALLNDGSVKCWGANSHGNLGDGTTTGSLTPKNVPGLSNIVQIESMGSSTCALVSDGTIKCWGLSRAGQLGNGTTTGPQTCNGFACSTTPVSVIGINNAMNISVGIEHACAVLTDGTIKCWGDNRYGQLGNGNSSGPETCTFDGNHGCSSTPVTVTGINNAKTVSAGSAYTCALLTDMTIKCWGANYNGYLGNGTTSNSASPVTVLSISDAAQLSAGGNNACGVTSLGNIKCWGDNSVGSLGTGSYVPSYSTTPVDVIGFGGTLASSPFTRFSFFNGIKNFITEHFLGG